MQQLPFDDVLGHRPLELLERANRPKLLLLCTDELQAILVSQLFARLEIHRLDHILELHALSHLLVKLLHALIELLKQLLPTSFVFHQKTVKLACLNQVYLTRVRQAAHSKLSQDLFGSDTPVVHKLGLAEKLIRVVLPQTDENGRVLLAVQEMLLQAELTPIDFLFGACFGLLFLD